MNAISKIIISIAVITLLFVVSCCIVFAAPGDGGYVPNADPTPDPDPTPNPNPSDQPPDPTPNIEDIVPIFEYTVDNGDGTFSAHFGYHNKQDNVLEGFTIPIGSDNQFSGTIDGEQDQGQPTLFLPGRHEDEFSVTYNADSLVWSLKGPNGQTHTAEAGVAGVHQLTTNASPEGTGSVTVSQSKPLYAQKELITISATGNAGYEFTQWSEDATGTSASTTVLMDANKTVTATFSVIEYNIIYNLDGGTNAAENPLTYTVEDAAITLADPTKPGDTFTGWSPGNAIPAGSTGDKTFTATWASNAPPTPTTTPDSQQRITMQGKLEDENSNPREGYIVELQSTPRTVITDGAGRYSFTDVEIEDHTLIIKDTTGTVLKTFSFNISKGSEFSWSQPADDKIETVVQKNTTKIDVTIIVAEDGSVTVDSIDNIVNPKTGSKRTNTLSWAMIAVVGCAVLILAVVLRRKRVSA